MNIDFSTKSAADLDRAIQKLADASGEVVKDTLTKQARLLCVDFAANTRPLEKGATAKKKGEENIEKRIMGIYLPVGVAYEILETHKKGYGAAFLSMVKKGQLSEAAGYLSRYSRKKFEVGNFDGGKLHKEQAFKGRTTRRMVVLDFPSVKRYMAEVKRHVGYAKGGFATAARHLGGTRGIPGFASRQPAPGRGSVEGDGRMLIVTVENDVKYIREALPKDREANALDFRRKQIESVLKRMMDRKIQGISSSLK